MERTFIIGTIWKVVLAVLNEYVRGVSFFLDLFYLVLAIDRTIGVVVLTAV